MRPIPCLASCFAFLLVLVSLAPRAARAEGSLGPELDDSQALRETTDIHVDILDASVETIVWTGRGGVDVYDPTGALVGTFASGVTIDPTMNGAYRLDLLENQYDSDAAGNIIRSTIVPWDVTVYVSGVARPGRVWSYAWGFNTGSFDQSAATNASFYARVPGGDPESFAVMELRTDGLAGFIFEIQGNSTGVNGPNAGRSVPEVGNSAANEYQIYLNPPDDASYTYLAPSVRDFTFRGGLEVEGSVPSCDEIVPGSSRGEFLFTSNVDGSFHLICDLDGDGSYELTGGDFLILGSASIGENHVPFDGLDNDGDPFPVGTHQCVVRVTVGEFHYVGRDIETSFRGLRMFQVRRDGTRTPLRMFWNDELVQDRETLPMPPPYAFISASTSGEAGLDSGDPAAEPIPLGETVRLPGANARAWGDFVSRGGAGSGKGNESFLDTYTWLDEVLSTPISIRAVDGTLDTDGEGLTDYRERCTTATDPMDPDSDGDSVSDFVETRSGMPALDADGDGAVDALDPDDDGDCVPTIAEDPDGDADPTNDDTDGDGAPDYLDDDDDADLITSCMEDRDRDGDPRDDDSDGDGIPDFREVDSDGDCALRATVPDIRCDDGRDACPADAETGNGHDDVDGCPEPDRDMDGDPDDVDNCPDVPNPTQEDLDDDGEGDACDADLDGDGLRNVCETPTPADCPADCLDLCLEGVPDCNGCGATDPRDPDSDDGGLPDGPEVARGSDPRAEEDDRLPGLVTGGGAFTCRAAPGEGAGLAWATLLALAVLASRRARR